MQRHQGMSLTFRLLVVGVILLALAVIVLGGFRGGWNNFEQFIFWNTETSDLATCENRVQGFCQQAENSGADWGSRRSHCVQYKDTIDSGDTTCPLEPGSGTGG